MNRYNQDCEHPDTNNGACEYTQGVLPACAPLANPYVPFQENNPPRYEARKGLIRGTLFPGLDLPFMGMVNTQEKSDTPMHELQAMGFAVDELVEYLDTHPDDAEAVQLLQTYAKCYKERMEQYERECGPLFAKNAAQNGKYTWLHDPWPWDLQTKKEG